VDRIVTKPASNVLGSLTPTQREQVAREVEWAAHVSSREVRWDNEVRKLRESVDSIAKSLEYFSGGEKYVKAVEMQTIMTVIEAIDRGSVVPVSLEFESLFSRYGLHLRQIIDIADAARDA
jgi:hypothetical protein